MVESCVFNFFIFFFFKQKTAYEMRISDWSSDVCSSDLHIHKGSGRKALFIAAHTMDIEGMDKAEGRALIRQLIEHCTRPQYVFSHSSSEERRVGNECVSKCRSRWSA